MSDDPTVLGMIVKQLTRIEDNQDEMLKCMGIVKVRQENFDGRIKKNTEVLLRHVENKEKHYNPYYSETFRERAWRKKGEIAVSVILGSVTGIIALLKANGVI